MKTLWASGTDAAIGSKNHPDSVVERNLFRDVLSNGYRTIACPLFGLRCDDIGTIVKKKYPSKTLSHPKDYLVGYPEMGQLASWVLGLASGVFFTQTWITSAI